MKNKTADMNFTTHKIYSYLTYIGVIPFIFCAGCFYVGIKEVPFPGSLENILGSYALIITTFLNGVHWGQHLGLRNKWAIILPISSNLIVIILWICYLAFSFKNLLIVFIVSFLILLFTDYYLCKDHIISKEYFKTRFIVSSVVVLMLIISIIYQ